MGTCCSSQVQAVAPCPSQPKQSAQSQPRISPLEGQPSQISIVSQHQNRASQVQLVRGRFLLQQNIYRKRLSVRDSHQNYLSLLQAPLQDHHSNSKSNSQQPSLPKSLLHPADDNITEKSIKETTRLFRRTNQEGFKVVNTYTFIDDLGRGAQAKVKLAIKQINNKPKKYAVKIYSKSKLQGQSCMTKQGLANGLDTVKEEIAILKKLDHPNIINLLEVIDDPNHEKIYMIMDLAENGPIATWAPMTNSFVLSNKLVQEGGDTLKKERLRQIIRESLFGLDYLHKNGIIHQDIKPQNLLLDRDLRVVFGDFGVSQMIQRNIIDQNLNTPTQDNIHFTQGTYHFMPPEAFKDNAYQQGFSGTKADIWSLGITLFAILFRVLPFHDTNISTLIKQISKQSLRFPKEPPVDKPIKNMLLGMLAKDPKKRSTLSQLASNPWLDQQQEVPLKDLMLRNSIIRKEPVLQKEIDSAIGNIKGINFLKRIINNFRQRSQNRASQKGSNMSPSDSNMTKQHSRATMTTPFKGKEPYRRSTMFSQMGGPMMQALHQFQELQKIKESQRKSNSKTGNHESSASSSSSSSCSSSSSSSSHSVKQSEPKSKSSCHPIFPQNQVVHIPTDSIYPENKSSSSSSCSSSSDMRLIQNRIQNAQRSAHPPRKRFSIHSDISAPQKDSFGAQITPKTLQYRSSIKQSLPGDDSHTNNLKSSISKTLVVNSENVNLYQQQRKRIAPHTFIYSNNKIEQRNSTIQDQDILINQQILDKNLEDIQHRLYVHEKQPQNQPNEEHSKSMNQEGEVQEQVQPRQNVQSLLCGKGMSYYNAQ